jgi:hypothetical protein
MEINWDSMDPTEDELLEIPIEQDWFAESEVTGSLSVVSKIFSRKAFVANAIRSPLKAAWRLTGDLEVRELGENVFVMVFDSKTDKERALAGGIWSFDKFLMLIQDFNGSLKPNEIVFDRATATLWVQIHDLPIELMTVQVGKAIGDSIGTFVEVDVFKDGLAWGRFLRVKVSLLIDKPLKRGTMLNIPNKGRSRVFFRYENLPDFCYKCGILSHFTEDCESESEKGPIYGPWLRANSGVAIQRKGDDGANLVSGVTKFPDDRPRGDKVSLPVSKKAATKDFEDKGHIASAKEMMQKYFISKIDSSTLPAAKKYNTPQLVTKILEVSSGDGIVELLQFVGPLFFLAAAFIFTYYGKGQEEH